MVYLPTCYIYHKNQQHVGKYNIHGSHGIGFFSNCSCWKGPRCIASLCSRWLPGNCFAAAGPVAKTCPKNKENRDIMRHQWSFPVPLIGGRWYIITQLAIYTTYHLLRLLREPETAIDKTGETRDRCFFKIHNWTFQQLPKSCYFGCQFTIFLGFNWHPLEDAGSFQFSFFEVLEYWS